MKRLRKILLIVLAVFFAAILLVGGYICVDGYFLYKRAVNETPIPEMVESVQSREGYVKYEDISTDFLNAIVAVEDRRFYTHNGFDIISTTRAVVTDLLTSSLSEGGSTITQQLAKNLYFSMEKQFDRKVAEVFTAIAIERQYSKETILELSVNVIYFGNNCYGIGPAAAYYFGKTPAELTLREASLLAGLPKAPSSYGNDPAKQLERQAAVLEAMVNCNYISKEEAESITNDPLTE